uniref:Uncharacterized protein n=1 Tax=Arundo donax TaxID=35708 RepID=A0A0A9A2W3_ARUDO
MLLLESSQNLGATWSYTFKYTRIPMLPTASGPKDDECVDAFPTVLVSALAHLAPPFSESHNSQATAAA